MMENAIIVGRLDVAELVFYAFVLFFIGLVLYLRREDRREGYPKEDMMTGRVDSAYGPINGDHRKSFRLPFDRGIATTPTQGREPVQIAARQIDRFPGAPYTPTGNPLIDGIGPAAYAERARWPDLDMEGRLRIVPIGADPHFEIAPRDPDFRGWKVVAADGLIAGTVSDIWIDRSDRLIRYFDVQLGSGRQAIVPMTMAVVHRRKQVVEVDALSADQFADAPQLATIGEMTRYEEERIMAYFGGGYLYGLRGRLEPLV